MPEEMKKLRQMLDKDGIRWVDGSITSSAYPQFDIYRTQFFYGKLIMSVISGKGTYGGNLGLLELVIGLDDPIGSLTAKDVMEKVKETDVAA